MPGGISVFEGPRKPELPEKDASQEARRARHGAGAPTIAGAAPGPSPELRKHIAILEREIAELEQA
jgi:hypothetical protein